MGFLASGAAGAPDSEGSHASAPFLRHKGWQNLGSQKIEMLTLPIEVGMVCCKPIDQFHQFLSGSVNLKEADIVGKGRKTQFPESFGQTSGNEDFFLVTELDAEAVIEEAGDIAIICIAYCRKTLHQQLAFPALKPSKATSAHPVKEIKTSLGI
ncbi:MAG: hypothetical protein WCQ50_10840 [Spirochaetota bacterium]